MMEVNNKLSSDKDKNTSKPKHGQRMEAAIIRNIRHSKTLQDEWNTLDLAKKRVETDMNQKMNIFALKSGVTIAKRLKNGLSNRPMDAGFPAKNGLHSSQSLRDYDHDNSYRLRKLNFLTKSGIQEGEPKQSESKSVMKTEHARNSPRGPETLRNVNGIPIDGKHSEYLESKERDISNGNEEVCRNIIDNNDIRVRNDKIEVKNDFVDAEKSAAQHSTVERRKRNFSFPEISDKIKRAHEHDAGFLQGTLTKEDNISSTIMASNKQENNSRSKKINFKCSWDTPVHMPGNDVIRRHSEFLDTNYHIDPMHSQASVSKHRNSSHLDELNNTIEKLSLTRSRSASLPIGSLETSKQENRTFITTYPNGSAEASKNRPTGSADSSFEFLPPIYSTARRGSERLLLENQEFLKKRLSRVGDSCFITLMDCKKF